MFRSKKDAQMLNIMRNQPYITYSDLAAALHVNRSAVQKQIDNFRKKGYLERRDDGR